eukprot:s2326_g7.t1
MYLFTVLGVFIRPEDIEQYWKHCKEFCIWAHNEDFDGEHVPVTLYGDTARLSIVRKGAILRTMVLPRLLYGAGAWPVLSKSEGHKFEATVLGMYRQLLCIRYDDSQHLAAPTICALARQPPPSVLLHLERLWCLRGLVVHGPPVLWGLVRQDDEYLSALRGSPTWLYARVHACVDMPHPCQDWGPWEDCIRRVPNRYKRLLNLASGLAASRPVAASSATRAGWRDIFGGPPTAVLVGGVLLLQMPAARLPCTRALLLDPAISQALLASLRLLDNPLDEEVWSVVCDFVEPLAILKNTVAAWEAELAERGADTESAVNVQLLLDPVLVCESFLEARVPRQVLSDCALPQWSAPGGFCLTLTGQSVSFAVTEPPTMDFRFPYEGSVALDRAECIYAFLMPACAP